MADDTGEVSLTGRILPIGGVKEKVLAARRSHIVHIIFPEGNKKDWDELSGAILRPGYPHGRLLRPAHRLPVLRR